MPGGTQFSDSTNIPSFSDDYAKNKTPTATSRSGSWSGEMISIPGVGEMLAGVKVNGDSCWTGDNIFWVGEESSRWGTFQPWGWSKSMGIEAGFVCKFLKPVVGVRVTMSLSQKVHGDCGMGLFTDYATFLNYYYDSTYGTTFTWASGWPWQNGLSTGVQTFTNENYIWRANPQTLIQGSSVVDSNASFYVGLPNGQSAAYWAFFSDAITTGSRAWGLKSIVPYFA